MSVLFTKPDREVSRMTAVGPYYDLLASRANIYLDFQSEDKKQVFQVGVGWCVPAAANLIIILSSGNSTAYFNIYNGKSTVISSGNSLLFKLISYLNPSQIKNKFEI